MSEPKYKCGPGFGARGEKAYALRCSGLSWREIALSLEIPEKTAHAESLATNLAKKYAQARELPWPIVLPKLVVETSVSEKRRQSRQRLAYEARAGGGGWAWVAEVTQYSCVPHAVAGARRYAQREGRPWPIPMP